MYSKSAKQTFSQLNLIYNSQDGDAKLRTLLMTGAKFAGSRAEHLPLPSPPPKKIVQYK
jgi:hypothetical protein